MEEGIIKTAPDMEKAKSILKMVETTLEMIDTIDSFNQSNMRVASKVLSLFTDL